MARIIGDLGSEKTLVKELKNFGIQSLRNLDDVENHIKNSNTMIQALKEAELNKIRKEIEEMKLKLSNAVLDKNTLRSERFRQLTVERDNLRNIVKELSVPSQNIFTRIFQKFRYWKIVRRQRTLENRFEDEVDKPFGNLTKKILDMEKSIANLEANFEDEILKRIAPQISEKEKIDKALEQVGKWLVGARGEREVVQSLAELPDSFVIINDVILHFKPPLRTDNGPRFKCQADHVVIGPSGVFNIETKYWSEKSIQSLDLRSPVEQIKVTGKGLWRELNGAIRNRQIKLNGHHWGDSKVSVRNVLVMVGAMPNAEFQMVKLLPVDRLSGYVGYFEPVFGADEVESITSWFTRVSPDTVKRSA